MEVLCTVRNLGPGIRSVINSDKRHVTLASGDSRKVRLDPFTAHLLLRDAASPRPKFEVQMTPETRVAMEQAVEEGRYAKPKYPMGNAVEDGKPTEQRRPATDKRFITDPKTVPDEKIETAETGERKKKGSRKAERLGRKRRRRQAEED